MRRLCRFLSVGAAGFVVDFTTMWVMLTLARLPPMPARVIAFVVTIIFTYVFNRAFTFADRPQRGKGEWASYALVSAAAAILNLGVFAFALKSLGQHPFGPYLAMPIGVAAGLVVNFLCYNFLVFRAPTTER